MPDKGAPPELAQSCPELQWSFPGACPELGQRQTPHNNPPTAPGWAAASPDPPALHVGRATLKSASGAHQ
eukprot:9366781-Alexandrium_andersonii.AAC.1